MRHSKSLNKLYYDIVLKEDIDERPFFIMQYDDGYIVFQDRYHIIKKFKNFDVARMYVNQKYYNPQTIIINFKKRD